MILPLPPLHSRDGDSQHQDDHDAKALAVGEYFSCALVSDGPVERWGQNVAFGELGAPLTLNESLAPRTVTW